MSDMAGAPVITVALESNFVTGSNSPATKYPVEKVWALNCPITCPSVILPSSSLKAIICPLARRMANIDSSKMYPVNVLLFFKAKSGKEWSTTGSKAIFDEGYSTVRESVNWVPETGDSIWAEIIL